LLWSWIRERQLSRPSVVADSCAATFDDERETLRSSTPSR
jgi:hypothetical protein